jgi:hypothetical protein
MIRHKSPRVRMRKPIVTQKEEELQRETMLHKFFFQRKRKK